MKIAVRGMGARELLRRLAASGADRGAVTFHDELFFDGEWPNPGLAGFLRTAAGLGAFDLNPWMVFQPRVLASAEFLRIRPRRILVNTDRDFERTREALDALPWRGEGPGRFRIPEQIFLTRIALKPNQIGVVGQWSAEYVVPDGVRGVFEAARLTGLRFRPVFDTRTDVPYRGFHQIHAPHGLVPAVPDCAWPAPGDPPDDAPQTDLLGCLCYPRDALGDAPDFSRTGEALVSFEFPEWVVRPAVMACARAHGLKGWAFEPVLISGSEQHRDYCALWDSFHRLLADCGAHTVRGRRLPRAQ